MILPLGALPIFLHLPRSGLTYIDVGHAFIVQALNLPRIHGRSFLPTSVCAWRQPTSTHRVGRRKEGVSAGAGSSGRCPATTFAFNPCGVGETRTTFNFSRDESRSNNSRDGVPPARTWRNTRSAKKLQFSSSAI